MSLVRYGIRIATFDLTSRPPSCIAAGDGTKTLAIAQIRETWLEALPWLLEACWVFVRSPKGIIAAEAQTFSWVLYCTVATGASPKRRRGWHSRHRAYCNDHTQRQGSHWPLESALHETEAELQKHRFACFELPACEDSEIWFAPTQPFVNRARHMDLVMGSALRHI